jgi:hypothetical protein
MRSPELKDKGRPSLDPECCRHGPTKAGLNLTWRLSNIVASAVQGITPQAHQVLDRFIRVAGSLTIAAAEFGA